MLRTPEGAEMNQSQAIIRYVGRLAEGDVLYPATDLVQAQLIDSILNASGDLDIGIITYRYGHRVGFGHLDDEAKAKAAKTLITEV